MTERHYLLQMHLNLVTRAGSLQLQSVILIATAVLIYSKNKFEKLVHLFGFNIRIISGHLSRNLTLLNFTELGRRFPICFLNGQTVTATVLYNPPALQPASAVYTPNICSITSFSHRK